jgi:hypothetical protein
MYQRSDRIDEVSPLFEATIGRNLPPDEAAHHLIFSPEFSSVTTHHPASVLCLTDRRWVTALAEPHGAVTTQTATFDETVGFSAPASTISFQYQSLRRDWLNSIPLTSNEL